MSRIDGPTQPCTQASSCYLSDQRRLGTERDSARASSANFPTSLTGDVTSEIAEDDLERGWVQPCLNLSLNPHLPFNNHVTYNRDAGVARGSRCILPLPPSPVLRWIIHLQNRSKLTDKHMDKVRRIVNPQLNRSIFKF